MEPSQINTSLVNTTSPPAPWAIILAGGLGTRLRSVVSDLPKCMAPVNGQPFLGYLVDSLHKQGITNIIFSVGYLHDVIVEYVTREFPFINAKFSIEDEPLGTGGAILLACTQCDSKTVVVCNGDTLFLANVHDLLVFHNSVEADCTLSVKPMANFDRYGVISLNDDHSVKGFKEKQWFDSGLINGGVYALDVANFISIGLPAKFSFESSYLEAYYNRVKMFGFIQDSYFVDIGIPADYEKAQIELPLL